MTVAEWGISQNNLLMLC